MEERGEAPGEPEPDVQGPRPLQREPDGVNLPEASALGPRQPAADNGVAAPPLAAAAPGAPEPDAQAPCPLRRNAEFQDELQTAALGPRLPAAEDGVAAQPLAPAAAANAMPQRSGGGPDTDCDGSSCSGTGTAKPPFIDIRQLGPRASVFIFALSPEQMHSAMNRCLNFDDGDDRPPKPKRSRRGEVEAPSD
jgi:hypothetical protein